MKTKPRLPDASSLPQRVEETVFRHTMLAGVDAVVLALSGGKDSVCLFHVLRELLPEHGVHFCAAHVNHNLRGEEALRDELFCAELCRAYGVEYRSFSCDVSSFAKEASLSLEDAARKLRYSLLLDYAKERGALLATAHTANDQAETVLMRLVRGSGLGGASGIAPVRADGVIRPLLDVTSGEVLAFLAERGFSFVTDCTNGDTRFARNFYRFEILPLLERQNPALVSSLCRFAISAREEHAAFLVLAKEKLASLGLYPITARMPKAPIFALSSATEQRALLHVLFSEMLAAAGGGALTESAFSRLLDHLRGEGRVGSALEVGGGFCFLIEQESLAVVCAQEPACEKTVLNCAEVRFGTAVFSLKKAETAGEIPKIHKMHTSACVSCDKIVGNLCVRAVQTGDTVTVNGNTRRIKDVFTMRKIPQGLRKAYPVVCDDAGNVWLPGELACDRVRSDASDRAVCLSLVEGELFDELLKRRQHE